MHTEGNRNDSLLTSNQNMHRSLSTFKKLVSKVGAVHLCNAKFHFFSLHLFKWKLQERKQIQCFHPLFKTKSNDRNAVQLHQTMKKDMVPNGFPVLATHLTQLNGEDDTQTSPHKKSNLTLSTHGTMLPPVVNEQRDHLATLQSDYGSSRKCIFYCYRLTGQQANAGTGIWSLS